MRRIKQSLPKNEKVQIHSKGFQSVFRSILLMIPLSVMLIVIAELVSLFSMERMADNFEHQTGIRVLNQVDQTFQQAYRVLMKMKMDENFTDYIKKLERDYYDEAVIYQQLLKQQSGYNNIEEVALYFPQYEYVLSSVYGGKESEIYQRASYACSFDKWKHTLDSEWKNGFQILPGTAGENKNLISAMISSNSGNQNYAHIFVQLDNSFLLDILSGLSLRGGEEAFICTENGMAASTLEDVEDSICRCFL